MLFSHAIVIDQIWKEVVGYKIWVSIDETTDVEGKFIANVNIIHLIASLLISWKTILY